MGLFCHILMGCPSSGKSTLAEAIVQQDSNYRIVSTDKIRAQLFGDATIQGNWSQIEAEVFRQIDQHLRTGYPVIYDATNAKRPRRMALLQRLKQYQGVEWLGWHLKTPLKTCFAWNHQRERQVPDGVIKRMHTWLKQFPPITAEGFSTVYTVNPIAKTSVIEQVNHKLSRFSRSLINRQNRTQQAKQHDYSRLLDFERLIYLIRVLLTYPGVGNLQNDDPETVKKVLGKRQKTFERDIDEIAAFMAKTADPIYADPSAIAQDLKWLEQNGIIGQADIKSDLKVSIPDDPDLVTHSYSDLEPFQRLIQTIRLIIHEPLIWQKALGTLDSLVTRMQEEGLVDYDCRDSLRKDIEKVLKPYGIIPDFPMKRGYFAGTAILSQQDLIKVFRLLDSQAQHFEDPVAFQVYQTFKQRMETAKFAQSDHYPVREIHHRKIVDFQQLPESSLARQTKVLEQAIENRQLMELGRIPAGDRSIPEHSSQELFLAYPIQIVFHNISWYLGLECYQNHGLLQFERLDRLVLGKPQNKTRSRQAQLKALRRLITLYQCSGGIYLGHDPQMQQQYLNPQSSQNQKVEVTIELWLDDEMFAFVSEETQQFPVEQMKMSKPFKRELMRANRSLFSLRKTGDPNFRHRFRLRLPLWSLNDLDLHRWILGFGGQAKVVSPDSLRDTIQAKGQAIKEAMESS